jgi:hypothetical protein
MGAAVGVVDGRADGTVDGADEGAGDGCGDGDGSAVGVSTRAGVVGVGGRVTTAVDAVLGGGVTRFTPAVLPPQPTRVVTSSSVAPTLHSHLRATPHPPIRRLCAQIPCPIERSRRGDGLCRDRNTAASLARALIR